ncbi:MAG: methyl-accepting chemotaxis protein, partial [Nevskia sp.]|nr:methyl-accepting chemotaxis protein [Nevskia sp.]
MGRDESPDEGLLEQGGCEIEALRGELEALARGEPAAAGDPLPAPLAERLRRLEADSRLAGHIAALLAACDLAFTVPAEAQDSPAAARLHGGFGNLSEAIRQAVGLATAVSAAVPEIAAQNNELAGQSQRQADAVAKLGERAASLLQALAAARQELQELTGLASEAEQRAALARESAAALAQVMGEVRARAASVNQVIEVVDEVALHTNVLSINAAIEAAHAGALGRGFAVVAREVRDLAGRAALAAKDARGFIAQTQRSAEDGGRTAERAGTALRELGTLVERTGSAVRRVAESMGAQTREVEAIDGVLGEVAELSRSNLERAGAISARTDGLKHDAEMLGDCVKLFRLPDNPLAEPRHAAAREAAALAAEAVGGALAVALERGQITDDELFSRDYTPIQGTDPPKHRTAFDALCDALLTPIQEPVVARNPWMVFAICANRDGYVPTHNQRFSRPLTGDRGKDLVGNRTKRIFGDRVGRTVGSH